jgi:hypothetical protein
MRYWGSGGDYFIENIAPGWKKMPGLEKNKRGRGV